MRFEFATATRILFGAGTLREVAPAARQLGQRALVVTAQSPERAAPLLDFLKPAGIVATILTVSEEPSIELVESGAHAARQAGCELVLSIGGGSTIDTGKAVAAMLSNPGSLTDYLEVVGLGRPLPFPSAPFIAIPTTAGTGSEVTRNAVLSSHTHGVKASLRSAGMLPRMAVVDPELTYSLPPAITASTGLDALTQLIEPYVSIKANPMTDVFCLEGIRRIARSIRVACSSGPQKEARADMSFASLLGGLSLANAGLGVVHGFAAPIGGIFPAPHGAICAAVLPHGMEANIRALRKRSPRSEHLQRYETIAQLVTQGPHAKAEDGTEWIRRLCLDLEIPGLRKHGVAEHHADDLVEKASKASSMKGNPIALDPGELREVLLSSL